MAHPVLLAHPETPETMVVPANPVTMANLASAAPQLKHPTGASTATPDHQVPPETTVPLVKMVNPVVPVSPDMAADKAHLAQLDLPERRVLLANLVTLVKTVNPVN